jgi:hypothetical protein
MTTCGRLQPGCMMKILEAERWQKSANPHEVALLQQQQEDKYSKPMQRLEAPRTWPNKDIKYGGHGPVSRGGRRGSRRDHRRAGSNCINECVGVASRSLVKLWPHLQTRILH